MMETKDVISVIIPVYNVESYLAECIDSVLAQDYSPLEIILVDDGSTDSSHAICEQYATAHSHIKVIQQENRGLAGARNTGLRHCTGEWIAFLDSDDWIESTMYRSLLEHAVEHNVNISACGFKHCFSDGSSKETIIKNNSNLIPKNQALELVVKGSLSGAVWNKLFSAKTIKHLEFHEKLRFNEDGPFTMEAILSQDEAIAYLPISLLNYRRRANSLTASFNKNSLLAIDSLEITLGLVTPASKCLAKLVQAYIVFAGATLVLKAAESSAPEYIPIVRSRTKPYLFKLIYPRTLSLSKKVSCLFILLCPRLSTKLWKLIKP